jgi:hypothetical protein
MRRLKPLEDENAKLKKLTWWQIGQSARSSVKARAG